MDSLYCQGEGIAGEKKANSAELPLLEVGFHGLFFAALGGVVVTVFSNLFINSLLSL